MKCIWRILLGVLTAGLSEFLRHKGHDKSLPCPEVSQQRVELGSLSVGDAFAIISTPYIVEEIGDIIKVRHTITNKIGYFYPDMMVYKIFIHEN